MVADELAQKTLVEGKGGALCCVLAAAVKIARYKAFHLLAVFDDLRSENRLHCSVVCDVWTVLGLTCRISLCSPAPIFPFINSRDCGGVSGLIHSHSLSVLRIHWPVPGNGDRKSSHRT